MLGDREIDESLVAELVKVSQTSVDRTSVSLLFIRSRTSGGEGGWRWAGGGLQRLRGSEAQRSEVGAACKTS